MKSNFYIDVDKAERLGCINRVSVTLNGRKLNRVLRAKHGKNGFVEYYDQSYKYDYVKAEILTIKKRGNVKVKFKPEVMVSK